MSRTTARLDADTPYQDGLVPLIPGADIIGITAGSTFTKIATGEFSVHYAAAAGAVVIMAGVSGLIYRTGVQDDGQSAFGSTRAGGPLGQPLASPLTLMTASIVAGTFVNIEAIR